MTKLMTPRQEFEILPVISMHKQTIEVLVRRHFISQCLSVYFYKLLDTLPTIPSILLFLIEATRPSKEMNMPMLILNEQNPKAILLSKKKFFALKNRLNLFEFFKVIYSYQAALRKTEPS